MKVNFKPKKCQFGKSMRFIREEVLGITQKELADKVGVTCVTICRYEKGERLPTVQKAYEIACALGFPLDEMMQEYM